MVNFAFFYVSILCKLWDVDSHSPSFFAIMPKKKKPKEERQRKEEEKDTERLHLTWRLQKAAAAALLSQELHASRHSDGDLQMESEEVAEMRVLSSKWKPLPERGGHVLYPLSQWRRAALSRHQGNTWHAVGFNLEVRIFGAARLQIHCKCSQHQLNKYNFKLLDFDPTPNICRYIGRGNVVYICCCCCFVSHRLWPTKVLHGLRAQSKERRKTQ